MSSNSGISQVHNGQKIVHKTPDLVELMIFFLLWYPEHSDICLEQVDVLPW